jgi:hypothetical protein
MGAVVWLIIAPLYLACWLFYVPFACVGWAWDWLVSQWQRLTA